MTRTEAIKEAKESSRDGCRYYVLENGKEAGISGYSLRAGKPTVLIVG